MKKFYFFLLIALATVSVSFAQKANRPAAKQLQTAVKAFTQTNILKCNARTAGTAAQPKKAPARAAELVTPPSTLTPEQWYTSGKFYFGTDSGWDEASSEMTTANVIIDGTDIYIQGLAYWFEDAWIQGTISGTTATFPAATLIGSDEYGDEYLIGSNTGSDVANITFTYDSENQVLTADNLIVESAYADQVGAYCYWSSLTISKDAPEVPEPVVAPDDLVTEEWILMAESEYEDEETGETYTETSSRPLNIGFYGDEVYIQGLNGFDPESWVKGTVDGENVTFTGGQYYGEVQGYGLYFFGSDETMTLGDVVMQINSAKDKMTTTADIITNLEADSYYPIDLYSNVVIVKVVEMAGTPQDPTILAYDEDEYGPYIECDIPIVDTDGNAMSATKLAYRIFKDINGEVAPFTLVAGTYYEKLTEDMTEIPYNFTENWDIYQGASSIYLYGDDVADWSKVGIQAVYYGGGETHESEIVWYEIKPYMSGKEVDYSFDFNAMPADTPTSSNTSHDGDITADLDIVEGDVTLTISPSDGGTPNRWWKNFTTNVIQLRVYGGTMTFATESGDNIVKIEFYNGKWNEDNSADSGKFSVGTDVATWTGSAPKVEVSIAGNSQLNKVVVYVDDTSETTGIQAVEIPVNDGIIYNLQGQRVNNPQRGIFIMNGKKFLVK